MDYTNLNKVCPNDAYPLLSIDRLVDGACGFRVLSFLDAYSGYNQIKMYLPNQEKTTFVIDRANFFYKVMTFWCNPPYEGTSHQSHEQEAPRGLS